MRNYTEEIRAQHDGKIYREVITFTDLDKNGNKIIVELLRGRRGKAEYIAVDVTRLDGEGVYTGAMDLNPQVERQERNINGVKCVNYVVVPGWLWLVQFQPSGFLIFDNIILLCRRLCAMLSMYSLINCIFISNCVNCLCNSIQLYCLWWLINCACLLPFFGGGSRSVYIAVV